MQEKTFCTTKFLFPVATVLFKTREKISNDFYIRFNGRFRSSDSASHDRIPEHHDRYENSIKTLKNSFSPSFKCNQYERWSKTNPRAKQIYISNSSKNKKHFQTYPADWFPQQKKIYLNEVMFNNPETDEMKCMS